MQLQFYKVKAIAIAAVFASLSAQGQVLSNPDFETYSSCPAQQTNPSYVLRATSWTRPTAGTSDYFNNCGYNISSHVAPYSGAGFVGGYMEIRNGSLINYKEYLTNRLSAPLVAGVTYTLSFYTAHLYGASPTNMAPLLLYNDLPAAEQGFIGAVFSTASPANANTEPSSFNYGSIVNTFGSGRVLIPATNTAVYGAASRNAWVPVVLQYTAAGGEEYMTFGQFRPGATSLADSSAAYYLFDNFAFGQSGVLPVSLQYFEASRRGDAAFLQWGTAAEHNNKGFEVQRSADGVAWTALDFISSGASRGNSATAKTYSYTDASPLPGRNFYRLAQTDLDGTQTYSPVQSLHFTKGSAVAVYPNPVQSALFLEGLDEGVAIRLFNTLGQAVLTATAAGTATRLDLSSLPAGMYIVRVADKEGKVTSLKVRKE